MAAAQTKLGHLVKGQLVGIEAVHDGADPGMVSANIVGTGGTTHVSAGTLESLFRLLSTNASFTTIATAPGSGPAHSTRSAAPAQADAAVAALVPLVHNLVAGTMPALHGNVLPPRAGHSVEVQVSSGAGWKTVGTGPVGAGGAYSLQVPGPGAYRIVYAGINGPVITVS
jgi:hypothetical protein